jgi:predicted 3-demethylubiquinone-9 3-methyltransferase (glyoxalase superfamily)
MNNPIYPCLWFDGNAKDAAEFYCSVFKNSVITSESPMVVMFESAGQKFMFLNGGPQFKINPAISFFVSCETAEETEVTWKKLLDGGTVLMPIDKYDWSERYGWLQDRFGVNWQLMTGRIGDSEQKFTPALMFTGLQNGNAEKAINFYASVFECSGAKNILRYSKDQNEIEGNLAHAQFFLGKHLFVAMDSSFQHQFSFNEGVSFVVECETQKEIDYYWAGLTLGGSEGQCGWLKDRFGVSWQIVPSILSKLMSDPSRSERVISAFLQMKKFEIEKLINA